MSENVTAVLANLAAALPDFETIYKDIHAHPELSMQETRTAGIAADHLKTTGFEVTTAASAAATSRETTVCNRITVAAAITTGSTLA